MSETEKKTSLRVKGRLMSASEIERTLVRLAHEIVEKSNGSEDLALVGIKRRGVPLAERLGRLIAGIEKHPVDTGVPSALPSTRFSTMAARAACNWPCSSIAGIASCPLRPPMSASMCPPAAAKSSK
jgi:hypothetical protein